MLYVQGEVIIIHPNTTRKIVITNGIFSIGNILIIDGIYRRKVFRGKMLEFSMEFNHE